MPSRLVALWCWYHGSAFRGYQSQPVGPTVQDTLQAGLRAAGLTRNPVAAGRTDLGVHARMMVLSLRVVEGVPLDELVARVNQHLPDQLGLVLAREAAPRFNAAWLASGKEYRYRLAVGDAGPWRRLAWRVNVDPQAVAGTLASAVGTRDFRAFHDAKSPVRPRTLRSVTLAQIDEGVFELSLVGDAFGRYMVRCLVGAAVEVAQGTVALKVFAAGLAGTPFRPTRAPPHGLVLWSVEYPDAVDPFSFEERRAAAGVPRFFTEGER